MFDVNITSGKHILTGVNYYHFRFDWMWENECANGVCFILDDKHYYALEDPDDGYRSYMYIKEADKKICKRTFPPQEVYVKNFEYRDNEWHDGPTDALYIMNADDNSIILKLEETHWDSYYPSANWEYHPENLSINKNQICL